MSDIPELLIVGQATIDDIYREGEGAVSLRTPGGDSIYATLGATVWPIEVAVITCIGHDYPTDKLRHATCAPDRTDWSGLSTYEGPSIHDEAFYYRDGRRTYTFDDPSLLDSLSPGPEDVPARMQAARYVHVAPENIDRQLELMQFFRQRSAIVSLDVESHFFQSKEAVLSEILALDPIFMPSLEHVQKLAGTSGTSPQALWPWVAQSGVSLAVVKCGAAGALIYDVKKREVWPVTVVRHLDIVDVTGAGDAFCGGFMAGLILAQDPVEAAAYGAVSASFVVESLGAIRPAHFHRKLAERRLEQLLQAIPNEPIVLN